MIRIQITGLQSILRRVQSDLLWAEPVRDALTASALEVERQARANAPKWRHVLAGSITHELIGSPVPLLARVGPARGASSQYARVMEYGRRPGKQPPVSAIDAWARSKGLVPYVVARSIGRKGIKGRFYMRRAAESSEPFIQARFREAAQAIERRWRSAA